MVKDNQLYLNDILDAILKIERFTQGISKEKFLNSDLIQSAVIRQLEIVGEAANKVSKDIQIEFDSIPWKEIIGTRNKLIHDYSDVDIILVWNIIDIELNDLEKNIREIFRVKGYKRIKKEDGKTKQLLKRAKKFDS